jgi:ABC-type phosphate transport system substrate-binding protein
MRGKYSIIIALAVLTAFYRPGLTPTAAQSKPAKGTSTLVVIVSRNIQLTDITLALLRRTFRGDPTEAKGRRLIPFNYPPDNALRKRFDSLVLGMTREQAGRYWVDRRIRGLGMAPRTVSSQATLRVLVTRLPGAIGYVTADQLNQTVQALRVNGTRHTDPGYPLGLVSK